MFSDSFSNSLKFNDSSCALLTLPPIPPKSVFKVFLVIKISILPSLVLAVAPCGLSVSTEIEDNFLLMMPTTVFIGNVDAGTF